ncbi:hypothetical protein CUU54_05525 [Pectobacterium polaris]|nr:hypothetical protein [Pectobacterium polaris]PWD61508.1 hypothetical protein DF209_06080 [Pectobacterium polaris]
MGTIARSGCLVLTWRISSWFGAQKPHQKPDICLQLPILHLAEKCLVQPGASIYAAKACAASDKNVNDVFEQHLCWPVGRVPFMGRVSASQAVRTAGMNTEGTAKRRDLP